MDRQEINSAMDMLTHGVYVLGVHTPKKDNLMTAAWLCQTSSSPATLIVAVGSNHLTAQLIREAENFTVSVLTDGQSMEAKACGSVSGRTADKTAIVETSYTKSGNPVVAGAAAHLECRVLGEEAVYNHALFIAEVVGATRYSDQVLTYHRKDFF